MKKMIILLILSIVFENQIYAEEYRNNEAITPFLLNDRYSFCDHIDKSVYIHRNSNPSIILQELSEKFKCLQKIETINTIKEEKSYVRSNYFKIVTEVNSNSNTCIRLERMKAIFGENSIRSTEIRRQNIEQENFILGFYGGVQASFVGKLTYGVDYKYTNSLNIEIDEDSTVIAIRGYEVEFDEFFTITKDFNKKIEKISNTFIIFPQDFLVPEKYEIQKNAKFFTSINSFLASADTTTIDNSRIRFSYRPILRNIQAAIPLYLTSLNRFNNEESANKAKEEIAKYMYEVVNENTFTKKNRLHPPHELRFRYKGITYKFSKDYSAYLSTLGVKFTCNACNDMQSSTVANTDIDKIIREMNNIKKTKDENSKLTIWEDSKFTEKIKMAQLINLTDANKEFIKLIYTEIASLYNAKNEIVKELKTYGELLTLLGMDENIALKIIELNKKNYDNNNDNELAKIIIAQCEELYYNSNEDIKSVVKKILCEVTEGHSLCSSRQSSILNMKIKESDLLFIKSKISSIFDDYKTRYNDQIKIFKDYF